MSGAMRRIGEYLGLLEDTGRYDDEFDPREEYDTRENLRMAEPARAAAPARQAPVRQAPVADLAERRRPVVVPEPVSDLSTIVTLHPSTYNDARAVGENYRDGVPVIMNLTEMDDSDAKRLVDFAAGLVFGTHGSLDRVTNKVFLLSPTNITVTAEEKARLATGGFFNQS
jgi:cell division inhibitor SepF